MTRDSVRALWLILLAVSVCNSQGLPRGVFRATQGDFEQERKVAVVVGVGHHPPGNGFSALTYAEDDANAVGDQLARFGYEVIPLTEANAVRGSIKNALTSLHFEPGTGTLVFFYSGHGGQVNQSIRLATWEAEAQNLDQTGMPLTDVMKWIKDTGARQTVVWLDACRENLALGGAKGISDRFATLPKAEGIAALYAAKEGEISWESPKLHHGVFTYFLLESLNKARDSVSGVITFHGVSDYVQREVAAFGTQPGNTPQHPREVTDVSGEILIAGPGRSTILRMCGSNTIGAALAPALAEAYLKQLGVKDVKVNNRSNNTSWVEGTLDGRRVAIEISSLGTDKGFEALGSVRTEAPQADDCDQGERSLEVASKPELAIDAGPAP